MCHLPRTQRGLWYFPWVSKSWGPWNCPLLTSPLSPGGCQHLPLLAPGPPPAALEHAAFSSHPELVIVQIAVIHRGRAHWCSLTLTQMSLSRASACTVPPGETHAPLSLWADLSEITRPAPRTQPQTVGALPAQPMSHPQPSSQPLGLLLPKGRERGLRSQLPVPGQQGEPGMGLP